jgi:LPS-assembly lipoprotein
MSSFSRSFGGALLALALLAPLAACTGFTPVYGERGLGAERIALSYAAPNNRLEQIIYQDLALRLGKGSGDVPQVSVSVSEGGGRLTNGLVDTPNSPADYTTDAQSFASQEAALDASRRAARLLADTIRLELLAALAK